MTSFYANQNLTSAPNPDWSLDFYDSIPALRTGLPQALLPSADIEELDPPQEQLPLATRLASLLVPLPPFSSSREDLSLAGLLDELAHPDEFPILPPDTVQPFTAGWTPAAGEVQQAFRSTCSGLRPTSPTSFSASLHPSKTSSGSSGRPAQS